MNAIVNGKPAEPEGASFPERRPPAGGSPWSSMSARARATRSRITGLADSDIDHLLNQIEEWRMHLDRLRGVTLALADRDRSDLRDAMTDLIAKFGVARAMLAELKTAGGSQWSLFKPGIELAWTEFEVALALVTDGLPGDTETAGLEPLEAAGSSP